MANKPLKSIKFPTLNDTYTVDVQKDGEYPLLTAGEALHLAGSKQTDKVPYNIRSSYKGYKVEDKIVGGTVVFNQLASLSVSDWNKQTVTMTISGRNINLVPTSGSTAVKYARINTVENHVYLVCGKIKSDGTNEFSIGIYNSASNASLQRYVRTENSYADVAFVYKPSASAYFALRFANGAPTSASGDASDVMLVDLTLMFGSTIADYIYSLETAHAGDGVSYFRSLFPSSYYAYNAHELMSVKTSGKRISKTGEETITYSLSNIELRGLFKIDNGNLYCDGDTYESNGTVTRRYGIVDLGTLNWSVQGTGNDGGHVFSYTGVLVPRKFPANCISTIPVDNYSSWGNTKIGTINAGHSSVPLFASSATITGASAFKTAMSGQYLVYELATSTTETTDTYTSPQLVYEDGTEEYIDTRTVAIPVGHESSYYIDKIDNPVEKTTIAPVLTQFKADTALTANDFRFVGDDLYRITSSIANGGTLTPNTNCVKTTVAEMLKTLLNG